MKNYFISILVIFLITLNIFLLRKQLKISTQLQQSSELNKYIFSKDTLLISNLKHLIKYNYVESINRASFSISDSLNKDRVVLYFDEGVCGSCIQELLM
jgi:hypothetical protein